MPPRLLLAWLGVWSVVQTAPLDLAAQEPVIAPIEIQLPPPAPPPPRRGGDGGIATLLSPTVGNLTPSATFQSLWYPQADVQGQSTELGFWTAELTSVTPFFQNDELELGLTTGVKGAFFQGEATLPNTLQPFPSELWNIRFGFLYRERFGNGWIVGANVGFGSPSDQPFHSFNEVVFNFQGTLRIPTNDREAWIFGLQYSPGGQFNFPVPGIAYHYVPSDRFQALIGVPFFVLAQPTDDWTLTLFYMPIRSVNAKAIYKVALPFRLYAGYEWTNESFFRVSRPDDNDRFQAYEMRLTSGAIIAFSPNFIIDLFAGYSFDRFYFEGQDFGDRNFNRINLNNTPYLGGQLTLKW